MTMRNFIHTVKILSESFTGNSDLDQEIDSELKRLVEPTLQEPVLDILSIIRANKNGITSEQLRKEMEGLYSGEGPSFESVENAARTAFMGFLFEVTRNGDSRDYHWIAEEPEEQTKTGDYPELDLTSDHAQMAKLQIEITHEMLERARRMGRFNLGGMARIAQARGIPSTMAMELAKHFVNQFPQMFRELGDGEYEVVGEERKDAMSTLRAAAARATASGSVDSASGE
jgi:hypothetical protein